MEELNTLGHGPEIWVIKQQIQIVYSPPHFLKCHSLLNQKKFNQRAQCESSSLFILSIVMGGIPLKLKSSGHLRKASKAPLPQANVHALPLI